MKILPGGIPTQETSTHQNFPLENPPGKLPPRKFSPGLFLPISLIVFLHLTLRFDECSQT